MRALLSSLTFLFGQILRVAIAAVVTPEISIGNELSFPVRRFPTTETLQDGFFKRACSSASVNVQQCLQSAISATAAADDVKEDLDFFKTCIVDFYCYKKHPTEDIWTEFPDFKDVIGTNYFKAMAKRVQLFFVRYNSWSNTLVDAKFRDVATGKCLNLLSVIAARYLYVIYVLNKVNMEDLTFGPCVKHPSGDYTVPSNGVCFITPLSHVTCTSDHDVALIGKRSGTVASQFNKFFTQSVGTDTEIPGFAKASEDLFDTNVYAFTLEYAMPQAFKGVTGQFRNQVNAFNADLNLIVQETVTAIAKMKTYNPSYQNELLSDAGEFNTRPDTKNDLKRKFHTWRSRFESMQEALAGLKQLRDYKTISSRRQLEMAYSQIAGKIELYLTDELARNVLNEMVMALMYNPGGYHTRGAIRHVVGWTQMARADVFNKITINDNWVSMLENWADANKEYNRECEGKSAPITICLPKMSKYLWRMYDAMFSAYSKLPPTLQAGLQVVDNPQKTGIRSIMSHWFTNVKRKGLNGIPSTDRLPGLAAGTTSLDAFIQGVQCTGQSKTAQLSRECMNIIHGCIRKYNRNLFAQLIASDPV